MVNVPMKTLAPLDGKSIMSQELCRIKQPMDSSSLLRMMQSPASSNVGNNGAMNASASAAGYTQQSGAAGGYGQQSGMGGGYRQPAAANAGYGQQGGMGGGYRQPAAANAGYGQQGGMGGVYRQPAAANAGYGQQGGMGGGYRQPAAANAGYGQQSGMGGGYRQPAAANAGYGQQGGMGGGYRQPAAANAGYGQQSGMGGGYRQPAAANAGYGQQSGMGNGYVPSVTGNAGYSPQAGQGNVPRQSGNVNPGYPQQAGMNNKRPGNAGVSGAGSSQGVMPVTGNSVTAGPGKGASGLPKPKPDLGVPARKGQKLAMDITPGHMKIMAGLGWEVMNPACDLDVSAFLLNKDGKVPGESWFVFYGQKQSPDGSTVFSDDVPADREAVFIDLEKLNPSVSKIVFVLTINEALEKKLNFSMVKDAYIRITDQLSGKLHIGFQLDEYYDNVTSMMIGEIYKHNDKWKFNAIGSGVARDLAGLCELYGVQVV